MLLTFCLALLLQLALVVRSDNAGSKSEASNLELLLKKVESLESQQRKYEEVNRLQQQEIEMLKSQIQGGNHHSLSSLKNEHRFRARRENENAVAFYGKMMGQHTNVTQNPILKFNKVVTNIGNPYSPNNGLFIAPVPGVYVFSTTIMTETSSDAHVGIFVNDIQQTNIKLYGTAHRYDTMSQTAVFELETHDIVSVKHYEGKQIFHYDYTSFSGFLLQEDYGQLQSNSIIG